MELRQGEDFSNSIQLECEYPGQTMMVALAIMVHFRSLQEAQSKGSTFTKAAESRVVPGAGCAVSLALDKLQQGVELDLPSEIIIERMTKAWRYYAGHQSSYSDRVVPGLEKAEPFIAEFSSRWEDWKLASQKPAS